MADIVTMGEILADFIYDPKSGDEPVYMQDAGGAPANVAAMAARLGGSAAFIGKVGDDMFGLYLRDKLRSYNVDIRGLTVDRKYTTPISFVRKNGEGIREYYFYRDKALSSDINMTYGEIDLKLIDECKIFHVSSMSLTDEPSRTAVLSAAEYAKGQGKTVSYDPNWRHKLWENKKDGLRVMRSMIRYADVIRASEYELQLLTDCGTMLAAVAKLRAAGVKLICITQGAKDCVTVTPRDITRYPAYKCEITDTTGAGDCFWGGFLYKLASCGKDITELETSEIAEMTMFANACGSLSASKRGAWASMPTIEEVCELIKSGDVDKK